MREETILVKMKNRYENKEFVTKKNEKYRIIEYKNAHNILIEFCDKYKYRKIVSTNDIQKGKIKNPYYPIVYGVGYLGEIDFQVRPNGGKHIKEYGVWRAMLIRCYDIKFAKKEPTYRGCIVCEEWKCFKNFYEWIIKQPNYKKWKNNEHWCIDKDILVKGNKVYSPKTCCLVPRIVNNLFTLRKNKRNECIGIIKSSNSYIAQIREYNKQVYLGSFKTKQEAFLVYKKEKERYIKEIAEQEYKKGNITKRCYDALMKYQVNIND